jgi:hypothetical protein
MHYGAKPSMFMTHWLPAIEPGGVSLAGTGLRSCATALMKVRMCFACPRRIVHMSATGYAPGALIGGRRGPVASLLREALRCSWAKPAFTCWPARDILAVQPPSNCTHGGWADELRNLGESTTPPPRERGITVAACFKRCLAPGLALAAYVSNEPLLVVYLDSAWAAAALIGLPQGHRRQLQQASRREWLICFGQRPLGYAPFSGAPALSAS